MSSIDEQVAMNELPDDAPDRRDSAANAHRTRPGQGMARNAWYMAAFAHELDARILARTILEIPIVLFRAPGGEVAALEDRCPHVGAPLSLGRLKGLGVQCGYHGMVFDHLGQCTEIPGQAKIPAKACVRSFPVATRFEHVWIWMGDPAQAGGTPLPDFEVDDAYFRWPRYRDMIPFKGNYSLMIQNLMDLTHLGYVHQGSIGGDPVDHARDEVDVKRTPEGVTFLRKMRDVAAPRRYVERFGSAERLDRWSEFEYLAPSVVRQNSGWGPVDGRVIEDRGGVLKDKMLHAITPSTIDSSYYFWDGADGAEPDRERAMERLAKIGPIIMEDVVMIEAQQQRLEGIDPRTLVAIRSDRPRLMMMEELERRVRQERC